MATDALARRRNPIGWLARSPRRAFLAIFLVTLAVQGFLLRFVSERHIRPHTRYEISAVAMALYERGEFADPYCLPTGPTEHMPPFVPACMALVYHLFGPTLRAGRADGPYNRPHPHVRARLRVRGSTPALPVDRSGGLPRPVRSPSTRTCRTTRRTRSTRRSAR